MISDEFLKGEEGRGFGRVSFDEPREGSCDVLVNCTGEASDSLNCVSIER